MLDIIFNPRKYRVKLFYEWHQTYHKWMNSIAKADLPELEAELKAIEWEKKNSENSEFKEYKLDMLSGQEAIVRRIIKEIEIGRVGENK